MGNGGGRGAEELISIGRCRFLLHKFWFVDPNQRIPFGGDRFSRHAVQTRPPTLPGKLHIGKDPFHPKDHSVRPYPSPAFQF